MSDISELTEKQIDTAEEIKRNLTNMKKDGPSRKDQKYIDRHKAIFSNLWIEFEERHGEIKKLEQYTHKYFIQDFYGQVKALYETALQYLERYQECLDIAVNMPTGCAGGSDETTKFGDEQDFILKFEQTKISTEDQKLRFKKQDIRMAIYRRMIKELSRIEEDHSYTYYEFKIKELSDLWHNILQLHEEIMIHATREDFNHSYFKEKEFETLQASYHQVMITVHELKKTKDLSGSKNYQDADDVKLPRLNIPTFDGNYKMWTAFHDIYLKVIHSNKRLGNAEKMQYLKTSLKGEAYKLIQHLTSSDANYTAAWDLIINRFNNKRILFSAHLDTLLNQIAITNESATALKQLHDTTRECMHAIENLEVDISSWSPLIAHILIKKLDKETHKYYEQSLKDPREIPQLKHVLNVLETRFQTLEVVGEQKRRPEQNQTNRTNFPSRKNWPIKTHHASTIKCRYCNGPHLTYNCQTFRTLSVPERNNFVKQSKTCTNCLNHGQKEACYSQSRCTFCKQQHHSLLHNSNNRKASQDPEKVNSQGTTPESENKQKLVLTQTTRKTTSVLLATALIRAKTYQNTYEYLRALIDPGSQATFITENAAQILGCPRTKAHTEICGMGDTDAGTSYSKIELDLIPRFPSNFRIRCEAFVLPTLTKPQPDSHTSIGDIQCWKNYVLADPTYEQPGPIDVIIGADIFGDILLNGVDKSKNGILAQKTEFGWILTGRTELKQEKSKKILSMISRTNIDAQLRKFWEIEETPSESSMTEKEKRCEEYYQQTTVRNSDGTYTVHIPFKQIENQLGESKSRALARLYQMEKRFAKDKTLREEYNKFMAEYLRLGHMAPVTSAENLPVEKLYYMPHQAVVKEESSTTKLRVVFDASTKSSTGISLNDMMHNGPKLQQDLQHILLRWRKHRWVFTADIEKMYRQVKIAEEQQDYQRIVWRFSPNDKIQEYRLTTVTYGTTSAPYLAIKTIQKLAEDEAVQYPAAAEAILKDFYVDDLMSGSHSIQKAKVLQRELIQVLRKGGFNLRKWKSNDVALIENLPQNLKDQNIVEIKEGEAIKTLGVYWNPIKDEFQFKVKLGPLSTPLTKRVVLSDIARLFDPLGWLAPIVIKAKLLLQELWTKGYTWDQPLEEILAANWIKYRNELSQVETITIPRWMHYMPRSGTVEIHGFCDASEKAYGAVVYSKITTEHGKTYITLLASKTKVAPLKKVTLPRLELCGAVLLTKLIDQTKKALEFEKTTVYAWTDSMVTLAWIKGKSDRWNTFVSNRVAEIQQKITPNDWYHVKSENNPADLVSRGTHPHALKGNTLWWTGPSWLKFPKHEWPIVSTEITTTQEIRTKQVLTTYTTPNSTNEEILTRFSTFRKLTRVLAYCNRFIANCRKQTYKQTSIILTVDEIQRAKDQIIKLTQRSEFSMDIQQLSTKKQLSSKSKILSLNPFIDEKGILRVGGRIQNSNVSYDEKHPIIVPHNHHVSKLLIEEAHVATLHGGNEATLAFTRRKYWILSGRSKVRQVLSKCVKCCRFRGQSVTQIMGVLPTPRVTPSKPFTHTGVDYAGPIQVRMSKGRGSKAHKGYISIFVCLSTKAIHIEAVTDLTTEAFLAAFRRFTARRGCPSSIYSDNGTTFVGAKNILDKDVRKAIAQAGSAIEGISWHFIPPAAPHFGGIWEAGVKSIKHHLKRVIGDSTLTFEELSTLLYQIEACLNSRPLYPLTSDPSSTIALTPGHFLIGKALLAPPEPATMDIEISALTRWKRIQKMTQDFWKVWQREYLSRLQQRPRWQSGNHNIETGKIVLIKDETCSPTKWPLAKIIQTHPGEDGIVRVVTLQYKDTTIKRPLTKICVLPIDDETTQETNALRNIDMEGTQQKPITSQTTTVNITSVTNSSQNIQNAHNISGIQTEKRKRTPRHPLRGRFLPISSNWTDYISRLKRKNKETSKSPGASPPKIGKLLLTTMLVLSLGRSGYTQYTIKTPEPGFYIEHIGQARLKRGNLRVELNLPFNATIETQRINNMITQMENACSQARKFSEDTQCNTFLSHLKDHGHSIINEIELLNNKRRNRAKRGLVGKLLQSVFGVNDEVYTDIETLERNQELLRQASYQQNNMLLSTMTTINDTERRIIEKINTITTKINKVITEVNKVEGWYDKIDSNKVNIHILAAYQISMDVLNELEKYYMKILGATFGQSHLLEFVKPSQIGEIIKKVANKIPPNLEIIPEPARKLEVSMNETNIRIYGFFYITEVETYDIIKTTPIPKKVREHTYIAPDISSSLLATNYNSQRYFEMTEEELKTCIRLDKQLMLCTPSAVSTVDNNPNCVIDEIYHRQNKQECPLKEFITPKIMWKHLFIANTWLYIADSPTTAAIKCNGNREDIMLTGIGIIQINQECLIQTQKNILFSEIQDNFNIKASFHKPAELNTTKIVDTQRPDINHLDLEPILRTSDKFFDINVNHDIISSRWKTIGNRAAIATGPICLVILIIICIWRYHHCIKWIPKRQSDDTTIPTAGKEGTIEDLRDNTPDFVLTDSLSTPPVAPRDCSISGRQHVYAKVNRISLLPKNQSRPSN